MEGKISKINTLQGSKKLFDLTCENRSLMYWIWATFSFWYAVSKSSVMFADEIAAADILGKSSLIKWYFQVKKKTFTG